MPELSRHHGTDDNKGTLIFVKKSHAGDTGMAFFVFNNRIVWKNVSDGTRSVFARLTINPNIPEDLYCNKFNQLVYTQSHHSCNFVT